MLKSKDIETVKNAMERVVRTSPSVPNVKAEVWLKSLFNSVQACTLKLHKNVVIVKARARLWPKPTDAKHARVIRSKKSRRLYRLQSSKVFLTITITSSLEKATKQYIFIFI